MRRRKRSDKNQKKIVEHLRQIGASVQDLSDVGGGVPDILVGFKGKNYLLEIKNPESKSYGLTENQVLWHDSWNGKVSIVNTLEEALNVIGAIVKSK